MSFANRLILKIKRPNSPIFRLLKRMFRALFNPTVPPLPRFLLAPLRAVYEFHFFVIICYRFLITTFYRNPIFQGRCASFGRRITIDALPFVSGHVEIHLGDDVKLGGNLSILSGAIFGQPKLIIKDRTAVGWGTVISVNSEILIEEDVIVSYDCRISDTDGHRREADLRAAGVPPDPKDVRPVRICKKAFVANGTHIMKGVTIGEGATVGSNSVVISDVPPYSLALGNPAEVLFKNYGRTRKPKPAAPPTSESVSGISTVDH